MSASRVASPAAQRLQRQMISLIRAFGLHRPDLTPCGHPMSVSAAHALMELTPEHPLTQNELAGLLRLQKSTVSRLIDELVRKRWVRRVPHPGDGRAVLLQLTDKGRQVARRVAASRAAKYSTVVASINESELESVLRALEVLVGAINDHEERPHGTPRRRAS